MSVNKKTHDDILDELVYEQLSIKVGTFRTLFYIIPSTLVATSIACKHTLSLITLYRLAC